MVGALLSVTVVLVAACGVKSQGATGGSAPAKAPNQIVIGTAYAASGSYASTSVPGLDGMKFWVQTQNQAGGVYVAAYHKKIPVKLVAYNDQSSASTAATLYNQLITQDKVNILVSDFGSELTAPAVTIAEEHQVLLFNQGGSSPSFFSPKNPYMALLDVPAAAAWVPNLVGFIQSKHIHTVALVYDSNEFTEAQAVAIQNAFKADHVDLVLDTTVPQSTTDYSSLLNRVAAAKPQAVLEFGYDTNDEPFLQDLQSVGAHYGMVFTDFAGQLSAQYEKSVGNSALADTFSYGFPPEVAYSNVSLGLNTAQFTKQFQAAYPGAVNGDDVSGYNTGLIIQAALNHAASLSQVALRQALTGVSGKITTVEGTFKLSGDGSQTGEIPPIVQFLPSSGGSLQPKIVYPASRATASSQYPAAG